MIKLSYFTLYNVHDGCIHYGGGGDGDVMMDLLMVLEGTPTKGKKQGQKT